MFVKKAACFDKEENTEGNVHCELIILKNLWTHS